MSHIRVFGMSVRVMVPFKLSRILDHFAAATVMYRKNGHLATSYDICTVVKYTKLISGTGGEHGLEVGAALSSKFGT